MAYVRILPKESNDESSGLSQQINGLAIGHSCEFHSFLDIYPIM
jgi:hypothetical protein